MNTAKEMKEKLDILADLKMQLEEKKQKFDIENNLLIEQIENYSKEISEYCIENKKSLKTDKYMAVFCKGKIIWDSKLLSSYSKFHPEILEAQRIGSAYVTFRKNTHVTSEIYAKIYYSKN